MTRATKLLAVTTALGIASSLWLFLDNRSLRGDLEDTAPAVVADGSAGEQADPTQRAGRSWLKPPRSGEIQAQAPQLPEQKDESRMERRARRTDEFALKFGRLPNETEDEYRARIMPLVSGALIMPRMRVAEMRRTAEEKAKVTPAQSAELDKAFDKVYEDVLDYTNKAITDGQLSPYERNVAGWLDYAGGLGGILTGANGQIGKILDANQIQAMYDSGFEWGEYLGLNAPWEKLTPPPPAPK
jgi:hypothetical protein